MELSQEYLKSILHYELETGVFTWLNPKSNRVKVGDVAGFISRQGTYVISINKQRHYAHRLAFLYVTGSMPSLVDHIDVNPSNCKWSNLRSATPSLNNCNMKGHRNNLTNVKGVYETRHGRFVGRIAFNKTRHSTRICKTVEEATKLVRQLRTKLHGEFANHG